MKLSFRGFGVSMATLNLCLFQPACRKVRGSVVKPAENLFTKIKLFAYPEFKIFSLNSEHELQAHLQGSKHRCDKN